MAAATGRQRDHLDGRTLCCEANGDVIPETGARPLLSYDAVARMRSRMAAIDGKALLPRWDGRPPDYAAAIDVLVGVREGARASS